MTAPLGKTFSFSSSQQKKSGSYAPIREQSLPQEIKMAER